MNRTKVLAALVVLVTGLAGSALAADEKKDGGDKEFAMKASAAGLAEVNLGNLAVVKASSPEVKQFARRMIADHANANRRLLDLANTKGLGVARTMDEKHQALQQKLAKLDGADFDRMFMEGMVKDHEEAVQLFEAESKDGKDAALKAWASQTLPVLKMHLETARDISKKTKGGGER
jgi:putative membrane protein